MRRTGLTGGTRNPLHRKAIRRRELNASPGAWKAARNGLFAVHTATAHTNALEDTASIQARDFIEGGASPTDAAGSE